MKLLPAQGYDSILVVCDRMTKMVYFVPTIEKTLAEGVARLFWDNIWKLYGLPESIITDRGAQFTVGVELYVGDRYKVVDSILPTDRWPNRKDKLGLRAILKNVHWSLTRAMARLVSNSRVCI